jgi:hypothetical protein
MAVQYWVDQMAADADKQMVSKRNELLEEELDKFMSGMNVGQGLQQQEQGWLNL